MTDIMICNKDKIDIEKWKRYTSVCQSHGTPTIVQINHDGQSPAGKRPFTKSPIALSPASPSISTNVFALIVQCLSMGTPNEMPRAQTDETIRKIVEVADLIVKAGFAGVDIRGNHSYLVSSFLSPKTNKREDEYRAALKGRTKFLFQITDSIRAVALRSFAVGVKISSADFSNGGLTEEEALDQNQ